MKKLTLILSTIILCLGCTREGPHTGCAELLNLVFTHNGSIEDFDKLVARDVYLHIYDEKGSHVEQHHITYDEVKGGRPYSIEQKFAGTAHIIAWAVEHREEEGKAPLELWDEDDYSMVSFTMGSPTRAMECAGASEKLFLGHVACEQTQTEEITMEVPIKNHLCTIEVIIEDLTSFETLYPGELTLGIDGTSYSYNVAEDSYSDRAVVADSFFYSLQEDMLVSEVMTMPASKNPETGVEDYIAVTVFEDGVPRIKVDTGIPARADQRVEVRIRPTKMEAIITVDSWQVKETIVIL